MSEYVPGRVSVVVPIYNVAPFLRDCLDSLRAQTYPDVQVVLVDDGSTDGCAAIAAEYAAADPRFQVITQANAGLSAARNNGLPAADGEFLAFVDSDDVVAAHGYELLVRALDGGADFAAGGVLRLNSRGPYQGGLHRDALKRTDLAAHVSRDHALLRDRTVWNKLYRREFYDRHHLEFPVGRLFEDVPVTIPAHALAGKVAVVAEPIYFWRAREGAVRSITQTENDLRNLVDRFYTTNLTRKLLDDAGRPDLRRVYERQAIWDKLSNYLKFLPGASPEYRDTFLDLAVAYLEQAGPDALADQPPAIRRQWQLVRERRMDDLVTLVDRDGQAADAARTAARPEAIIHDVAWRDGRLELIGTASTPPGSPRAGVVRLYWLKVLGGRRRIPLWARPHRAAGPGGFRIVVDPAALLAGNSWTVAGATTQGLHRPRKLPVRLALEFNAMPPGHTLADGVRVTPVEVKKHLRIQVTRAAGTLAGGHRDGADLVLTGRLRTRPADPARIDLSWAKGVVAHSVPAEVADDLTFTARVPLAAVALPGTDDNHATGLYTQRLAVDLVAGGKTVPLAAADDFRATRTAYGADEVYLAVSETRQVRLCTRPLGPVVTAAELSPAGVLTLRGDSGRPVDGELLLRLRGRHKDLAVPLRAADGPWTAVVDLTAVPTLAGPLPLVSGVWDVTFRADGQRRPVIAPLGFADEAWSELPGAVTTADGTRIALRRAPAERITVSVAAAEVTSAPGAELPLRDVVLFDAAPGRRYFDDPAALLDELIGRPGAPVALWTAEHGEPVPDGATGVRLGGEQWRAALATSRWIITNDDLPRWFRPRAGQTVLRLAGGWPVARFGALAAAHPYGATLIEQLTADAGKWTAVASPGRDATPVLRQELRFDGPVLEFGRPAADVLEHRDHESARIALAERLGLDPATRFVLYAPTRRLMDLRKRGWSDPGRLLDLRLVADALPAGHRLLVRRHPALHDDVAGLADGVLDVSTLPRASDLLPAVGVLISDYSSLIADYSATGRPVLLYVPDLADFRSSPGLNLDVESSAPGPLLSTSAEVADALRDLETVTADYAAATKSFAAAHGPRAAGRASANLVDWLLSVER
ncbi:CDP-glycerol glycerophosphotransferase family protein [Actinoplanes sp. L3-i22]|uniref:bifunctional glycosyltransferase/CDP-glycerol:glycerophosphate glycerophosphotransferase n=1 Tax=Actinoplanes sp. L3-i22 TaxID=2836373 RepID=UPI001C77E95A|nr:CDP-glycerol glycerophosphotransferase family protein [Actinoplanes sp. L3-i22]BCY14987.1 hypothetical protein L3i22_100750 [Actinoplanes sp. L3-i22]